MITITLVSNVAGQEIIIMSNYGYARVSSLSQSTDIQVEALIAAGCTVIRTEKKSGRSTDGRTELATILEFMAEGDSLCVHKLDRLGRNTRDVLNLVHILTEKRCSLRVLEPAIDTSGPMGKVMLTVLGMVSEMELGFIKERQRAGIEKAKVAGVYKGRKKQIDDKKILELTAQGKSQHQVAELMGITRMSVYRYLKKHRSTAEQPSE